MPSKEGMTDNMDQVDAMPAEITKPATKDKATEGLMKTVHAKFEKAGVKLD